MRRQARELPQKLSNNQRAELAGSLMASWETNIDPDVEAARQEQIARRRHEVLSGKVSRLPGDSVLRKARRLLDGK